jgi:hypothetical protein
MMRTHGVLLPLTAVIAALAGCDQVSPSSPSNEAVAAIKARLGPDYEAHLMTTHKTPTGVVVCGYAGPKLLPPTDKAYPFPPGDRVFLYQDRHLTLGGDTDPASFDATVNKACPDFPRAPYFKPIP